MKKILMTLMLLFVASGFVFAQEVDANTADAPTEAEVDAVVAEAEETDKSPLSAPTMSGDATFSWGINFGQKGDAPEHGFKNESEVKVEFPILGKFKDSSKHGSDSVYAEISVADLDFSIKNLTDKKKVGFSLKENPKLSAKLGFYGAYISVFDKPSLAVNYADMWKDFADRDVPDEYKLETAIYKDGYGTEIGYTNADIMDMKVALKLVSDGYWNDKPASAKWAVTKDAQLITTFIEGYTITKAESEKTYFLAVGMNDDGSTKYEKVTFSEGDKISGDQDKKFNKPIQHLYEGILVADEAKPVHSHYGMGVTFGMAPLGDMFSFELATNVKFYEKVEDVFLNGGLKLSSKPLAGLELGLGTDMSYTVKDELFGLDTAFTAKYLWIDSGVYYKYADKKNIVALRFGFETKAEGDTNLLPGLAASFAVQLSNLVDPACPIDFKSALSYVLGINDSMAVEPYAKVWGSTKNVKGDEFRLSYAVGVNFMPMEKTIIFAHWQAGNPFDKDYDISKVDALQFKHIGCFELGVKISW